MQAWPLTVDRFIDHAARWYGNHEIVSRLADGAVVRTSWAELLLQAKRVSNALLASGIKPGDRVGTLAMNSAHHLACWYGIMGIGAVCHTLNPRLSDEQLTYIINHAEDRLIFADKDFTEIVARLLPSCPAVEKVVSIDDTESWEGFTSGHSVDVVWGMFDEQAAAGLCYTSGTTGDPKGVLYSHRSNYLHTMMTIQPNAMNLGIGDVIMPVVPMFHANAWGLAFAAPAVGSKLVLPGARLDGASLYELMENEGVTVTAGVPTVWQNLLQYISEHGLQLSSLKRVLVGGAACPRNVFDDFNALGVEVVHAWGMTELSPLGTCGTMDNEISTLPRAEQMQYRVKQGRVLMGIDIRIVDDKGAELPRDGKTSGFLQVRGHSVVAAYYKKDGSVLDADGFFDTGDIATIDPRGFMRITDRAKDVIKSGGEWISSVDMENTVMSHPGIELAAVIGVPHPKWDERPLLIVKRHPGQSVTAADLQAHIARSAAKWEVPDAVLFVDHIPLTATGKLDKKHLRGQYGASWQW
ncbi:long-chain-fatty-acid--CoA ligase [Exilibacterium tricleocarpae]|uniref:Long-chain-fatty-acid--CoA ligase n=2 Tax=Exilibacterium tricleocarpae TaxID=2591008 RepID=A0A545TNY3_9GAMM|nr:long-chain-fatty-acid--CoA ligase [Exilibacterium tricleocarpae]